MITLSPHFCPRPTPDDIFYSVCNSALSEWLASWHAPWWVVPAGIEGVYVALAVLFLLCLLIKRMTQ